MVDKISELRPHRCKFYDEKTDRTLFSEKDSLTGADDLVAELTPLVGQVNAIVGTAVSDVNALVGAPVATVLASVDGTVQVTVSDVAQLVSQVLTVSTAAVPLFILNV